MTDPHPVEVALEASPVVLILRDAEPDAAVLAVHAAHRAGVGVVEITVETPRGRAALARAIAEAPDGILVCAGTVRSAEDVQAAGEAGAGVVVSPGFAADVAAAARTAGALLIPGVATASEVLAAHAAGLRLLKAFPASLLGPTWLAAMRGPFPEVRFIVTGGVSPTTARGYLDAGAVGVGISLRDDIDATLGSLGRNGLIGPGATS